MKDTHSTDWPESGTKSKGASSIGNFFDMMNLRIECNSACSGPGPITPVMGSANLSDRKQSAPKCATDRDQSQSSMQAIGLIARRTIGLVSHAAGSHSALDNSTRFMVRVRFRKLSR